MPLFDKIGDLAKNVSDKAASAVGAGKISLNIKTEQLRIEELQTKIGVYYYERHLKGESFDPYTEAIFSQIDDINDNIEALEAEKSAARARTAGGSESGQVYCANCGAKLQPGSNFCSNCGGRTY